MNVAVIPARGGSKRIPRKNARDFCGKPMIAWSIETAKQSNLFERIIVSTDDGAIADIAVQHGVEVPFTRPGNLSDDHCGTVAVIAHATHWMLAEGMTVSAVCCIYATAPLLKTEDLVRGIQTLESGDWAYAFSATSYASSIFRAFRDHPKGGLEMLFPENRETRSQDLPVALHDAAQFYWGRPDSWIREKQIFDRHSAPVMIPRWRVQDIDSEEDWRRAELLHQLLTTGEYT